MEWPAARCGIVRRRIGCATIELGQHAGELARIHAAESSLEHRAHEPLLETAEAGLRERQACAALGVLEAKRHDGVDGAAPPAEAQQLRLLELEDDAVDDAVESRRGICPKLEFVADARLEVESALKGQMS